MRIPRRIATIGLLAAALTACGSHASSSLTPSAAVAPAHASARHDKAVPHITVAIRRYAFAPGRLVIAPGTRVTFVNHDGAAHTASAHPTGAAGFDTGTINPGRRATLTFAKPGTYTYLCQFHAFMHGTIVVR